MEEAYSSDPLPPGNRWVLRVSTWLASVSLIAIVAWYLFLLLFAIQNISVQLFLIGMIIIGPFLLLMVAAWLARYSTILSGLVLLLSILIALPNLWFGWMTLTAPWKKGIEPEKNPALTFVVMFILLKAAIEYVVVGIVFLVAFVVRMRQVVASKNVCVKAQTEANTEVIS